MNRGTLFPEYVDEREQQIGREAVRREILSKFASKPSFTVEDVKRHCMQETDCVLKEGEYRKLVSEMRKKDELERSDSGPMTKDARFRVKARA